MTCSRSSTGGSRVCTFAPVHDLISVEVVIFIMMGVFIILALALSAWRSSYQQVRGPKVIHPCSDGHGKVAARRSPDWHEPGPLCQSQVQSLSAAAGLRSSHISTLGPLVFGAGG
jgi:hypothetical protein